MATCWRGRRRFGFPLDGLGDEDATWTVDVTYDGFEDHNFLIEGTITITNTGNADAVVEDVSDVLTLDGTDYSASVSNCSLPATLEPGDVLTCDYELADVDADGSNTATVTTEAGNEYSTAEPEAVVFGDVPDNETDASVTISDTNAGFAAAHGVVVLDAVDYDAGDVVSFEYSESFAVAGYDPCSSETIVNTATLAQDDRVDETADATLKVNVECEGALTVTKTVETSFDRDHDWSIAKSVDTENGYLLEGTPKIWLSLDGLGDEDATWTVDVTYDGFEDHNFLIEGTITIENTGDLDAVVTSVDDVLTLDGTDYSASVSNCSLPATLEPGDVLTCDYELAGVGADGVNTATVEGEFVDSEYGYFPNVPFSEVNDPALTDAVVFGDVPDNETDASVTISDTNAGFAAAHGVVVLDAVDYDAGDVVSFEYSESFAVAGYDPCSSETIVNTATLAQDDRVDETADATLKVNVECEGALTVTKTVETSFDRDHDWSIAKSVDTENGYLLEGTPKIWLSP
jgi:hypothetical protein